MPNVSHTKLKKIMFEKKLGPLLYILIFLIKQVSYRENFEPYIILRRDQTPFYNEKFVGHMLNKISHAYEVFMKGYVNNF